MKLLWLYLLDKCSHAGIYKICPKLEELCLGFKPDWSLVEDVFGERLSFLEKDKIFLPGFVEYQYKGSLNPDNRAHKSVIDILQKEGAYKGLTRGLQARKDKNKIQVKVQEQDKKKKYGEYKHISLTDEQYSNLNNKLGDETETWIKAVDEGIELKGYKYKNHYLAILKWSDKDRKKERDPDADVK